MLNFLEKPQLKTEIMNLAFASCVFERDDLPHQIQSFRSCELNHCIRDNILQSGAFQKINSFARERVDAESPYLQ